MQEKIWADKGTRGQGDNKVAREYSYRTMRLCATVQCRLNWTMVSASADGAISQPINLFDKNWVLSIWNNFSSV